MAKILKIRTPRSEYTSSNQLPPAGIEIPFYNQLDPNNRWAILSAQIPGDDLVSLFNKHNPSKETGRPALNPSTLTGTVIIKLMLNLDDHRTVAQIAENMYPQYFLGYSSYIYESPLDASLVVDIKKPLGQDLLPG